MTFQVACIEEMLEIGRGCMLEDIFRREP